MREVVNFYCDESCHLENDNSNVMVIGTAYYIEYSNKMRRLIKEYEAYKKTKTA